MSTEVEFGYGQVTFNGAIEAVPASEHRDGNVTVRNMATPGRPAHFEVSTMFKVRHEEGGLSVSNTFFLTTFVTGLSKDAPYDEVDAVGARSLASLLRAIAESVETQVAEYDAGRQALAPES